MERKQTGEMQMTQVTVRHPASGDRYAVEIGPSDFYGGQIRILRVAGPLHYQDDPGEALLSVDPDQAELDATWLSGELGKVVDEREANVYGDTLRGLLGRFDAAEKP